MGEGVVDKAKEGQESGVKLLGKYFFTMRATMMSMIGAPP